MVSSKASGDEHKLDPLHYRWDECSFSLLYQRPLSACSIIVHARV